MFEKKYPEAEAAFKKVIDEGSYSLLPDYGAIFRKTGDNNNAESIFDIKHKSNSGAFLAKVHSTMLFYSLPKPLLEDLDKMNRPLTFKMNLRKETHGRFIRSCLRAIPFPMAVPLMW